MGTFKNPSYLYLFRRVLSVPCTLRWFQRERKGSLRRPHSVVYLACPQTVSCLRVRIVRCRRHRNGGERGGSNKNEKKQWRNFD